jgi:hypothetical protein
MIKRQIGIPPDSLRAVSGREGSRAHGRGRYDKVTAAHCSFGHGLTHATYDFVDDLSDTSISHQNREFVPAQPEYVMRRGSLDESTRNGLQ